SGHAFGLREKLPKENRPRDVITWAADLFLISIRSSGRPGESSSAKHMCVQMRDALAGGLTGVYHQTVTALGDIQLVGDLRGDVQQVPHQRNVQLRHIVERLEIVLARNQHNVDRRLRIDVLDGDDLFVFVDEGGRRVVSYDVAKDATLFQCFFHISRGHYQLAIPPESNTINAFFRTSVQKTTATQF